MTMESVLIGIIMLAAGVFCSIYVRARIRNKNIEIQYMKTSTISEVRKTIQENEAAGLAGYREYVELKGLAHTDIPQQTPYSKRDVAYYEAELYQITEEMEIYKDDKGNTQQRLKRVESIISQQDSSNPIILKDAQTREQATILLTKRGMQLDTVKILDKFEPQNMMQQYGFFHSLNFAKTGGRTLGFRMVEKAIPLNHPLYVLGEAFMENGQLCIGKPSDSKKPFIVSVKNEAELVQSNKFAEKLAFVGGIGLAVVGVAIMIFG